MRVEMVSLGSERVSLRTGRVTFKIPCFGDLPHRRLRGISPGHRVLHEVKAGFHPTPEGGRRFKDSATVFFRRRVKTWAYSVPPGGGVAANVESRE